MTAVADADAAPRPVVPAAPDGRVALVFPYVRTRAATELLFPPLGLAALTAQLRQLGVETRVFDCTFGSLEGLRGELAAWRPDVVGVGAMVSLTGAALRVAEAVRADLPGALLVAGGPLPTVFPRRFIGPYDAVVRGEADLSFPRLCLDYLRLPASRRRLDELELTRYDGLLVEQGDLHVDVPSIHHSEEQLRAFPIPDRSDFDHAAYQTAWSRTTGARPTSLIATLGCPYGCDFCSKPVFGNEVRHRDLDAVVEEIRQLTTLGYDSLWIADDTLTVDEAYLSNLCRRLTPLGITWSCLSRADRITPGMAATMRAAGCRRVHLGLESGSQATLDLMRKQATVEDGVAATSIYRAAGIEVAAFFIVGYPGETPEAIEETLALALALPLDDVSFNVPMPLPGSRLYERLGGQDPGRDWTRENELTFVFPTDLDEAWLRRRVDETLAEFARRREARRGRG